MSCTLYRFVAGEATLEQAVQDVLDLGDPGRPTFGMLSSATRFRFVRIEDGALQDPDGSRTSLAGVFEARLAGPDLELRWLHEGEGVGRAVVLADSDLDLRGIWWERSETACLEPLKQTYLLWGTATVKPDRLKGTGWSQLGSHRVGLLDVPLDEIAPRGRARLTAVEYVARRDDGNVVVIEERLTGLEVCDG